MTLRSLVSAMTLGAALVAAPALAHDPYDRAHGFGQGDPYARDAVDQCAAAAESRASRFGRARVERITNVDRKSRGFLVSGALAMQGGGGGWRHDDRWGARRGWFKCRTEFGRVVDLRVDRG